MNIFMKPNIFNEEVPVRDMAQYYLDFFALAQKLRIQLGTKAYLLDNYISRLLEVANEPLSNDADQDGMESISGIYAICRASMKSDGIVPHPFFKDGKDFILSHPLTFQERETKTAIYISLLANDYLDSCVKSYRKQLQSAIDKFFDSCALDDLYQNICELLGDEKPLEELNELFYKRFLSPTAMSVYLKQLNNNLVEALAYRDMETSLQVFQLIMNFDIFKDKA